LTGSVDSHRSDLDIRLVKIRPDASEPMTIIAASAAAHMAQALWLDHRTAHGSRPIKGNQLDRIQPGLRTAHSRGCSVPGAGMLSFAARSRRFPLHRTDSLIPPSLTRMMP